VDIIHDASTTPTVDVTMFGYLHGAPPCAPAWRKSSRSGTHPDGNCVEIARLIPGSSGGNGCHCCGGSRTMGNSPCSVCSGTGQCGCH
jgi:Domain of unknown function (DUF397)